MIIAFVTTKGGGTKTTCTMLTAIELVQRGHSVTVLDFDHQGSSTDWANIAEDNGTPLPFEVRASNLASARSYKESTDFTVVDTPPGGADMIDAAVKMADIVVIPSPPAPLDTDRVWRTAQVIAPQVPTYVLVTRYDARSKDGAEFIEELDRYGLARFETVIPDRKPLGRARGTIPKPSQFRYDDFITELLEVL